MGRQRLAISRPVRRRPPRRGIGEALRGPPLLRSVTLQTAGAALARGAETGAATRCPSGPVAGLEKGRRADRAGTVGYRRAARRTPWTRAAAGGSNAC